MGKNFLFTLLASSAAALLSGGTVSAEDLELSTTDSLLQRVEFLETQAGFFESSSRSRKKCCDGCCGDGCCGDECCGDSCCGDGCCGGGAAAGGGGGRVTFLAEFLLLRFFSADGVDDDQTNGTDRFDFDIAPRLTLGYKSAKGLSTRLRYFDYNHSAFIDGDPYAVETFNIDVEVAQDLKLGRLTRLEVNMGGRFNHYEHREYGSVQPDEEFNGVGLTFGLDLRREVGVAALYGKARQAILLGESRDHESSPPEYRGDAVLGQLELGLGIEFLRQLDSGRVLSFRSGFEVQQWFGYEDEEEDVGFGGFLTSVGLNY